MRLSYLLFVALVSAGAHRDGGRRRGDHLVLLLQPECETVLARQSEGVVRAEAPLDTALAGFIRLAVLGRLRDRSIVPVPLQRRTVEIGVVVGAAPDVHGHVHAKGRKAGRGSRPE